MIYLGWIVAAFLSGILLTVAAMARMCRRQTLHERFDGLGLTLGKDYAEIMATVKVAPGKMERRADGAILRTWTEGNYTISLLFDGQDYCMGVVEEYD